MSLQEASPCLVITDRPWASHVKECSYNTTGKIGQLISCSITKSQVYSIRDNSFIYTFYSLIYDSIFKELIEIMVTYEATQ